MKVVFDVLYVLALVLPTVVVCLALLALVVGMVTGHTSSESSDVERHHPRQAA